MAVYKRGDVDPSPELDRDEWCGALSPDLTFVCTWPHGHMGQHVAGTGEVVAAAWSEVCPECKGEAGWHWRGCESTRA